MAIQVASSLAVGGAVPVDSRFVFADKASALAGIPGGSFGKRYVGLTVFIQDESTEYWFKDGVTDADFVVKTGSASGGVSDMLFTAYSAEPLSTLKTLISTNGLMFLPKTVSSWNFRNLDQFDFNQLTGFNGIIEFIVTDGSSGITIDLVKKTIVIFNFGADNRGIYYFINRDVNGAPIYPYGMNPDFPVSRHLLLAKNAYDNISDADLTYISQFIKFTRPAYTIDSTQQLLETVNSLVSSGQLNDSTQRKYINDRLNGTLSHIFIEDVEIPSDQSSVTLPLATDGLRKINPLFIGSFKNLADLRNSTVPWPYLDQHGVPVGFFARLTDPGKIAILEQTSNIALPLDQANVRWADPQSGSKVQRWDLTGLEARLGELWTAGAFNFTGNYTQTFEWYCWSEVINFASQVGNIVVSCRADTTNFELSIVFQDPFTLGSGNLLASFRVDKSTGIITNATWAPDFTLSVNGVVHVWSNATKILEASEPLGFNVTGTEVIWGSTRLLDLASGITYFVSDDMASTYYMWGETASGFDDPNYPVFISGDGVARPGLISGLQLAQILDFVENACQREDHTPLNGQVVQNQPCTEAWYIDVLSWPPVSPDGDFSWSESLYDGDITDSTKLRAKLELQHDATTDSFNLIIYESEGPQAGIDVVTAIPIVTDGTIVKPEIFPVKEVNAYWKLNRPMQAPFSQLFNSDIGTFPVNGSLKSMIWYLPWVLKVLMGKETDLLTVSKQLVGAINELKLKIDALPAIPALPSSDGDYKLVITGGVPSWEIITP